MQGGEEGIRVSRAGESYEVYAHFMQARIKLLNGTTRGYDARMTVRFLEAELPILAIWTALETSFNISGDLSTLTLDHTGAIENATISHCRAS